SQGSRGPERAAAPPRVRLSRVQEALEAARRWLARGDRVAVATVVATRRSAPRPLGAKLAVSESGDLAGSVSGGCVESDVAEHAREVLASGRPRLVSYRIADEQAWEVGLPCGGEIDVFIERVEADARARFAASGRIPSADELVVGWPEEVLERFEPDDRSAVVVLTHEDRWDVPALAGALASDAFYVGALGSRRAQARRREQLLETGISEEQLERLCGPAGLDLGAGSPAETAVSILAEILAVRAGRDGGRLRASSERIHA